MSPRVRQVWRCLVMAGLVAVLVIGAAGCGDNDDLPPPVSPAASEGGAASPPSPPLDARDAEAWKEIQAKFDGFMETWIKWAAQGSPGGFEDPATAELHDYAAAFLWDEAVAELAQQAQHGQRRTGRPDWRDAHLLVLDWDRTVNGRKVPEARFDVCVDDREWIVVEAGTGEPVSAKPGGPSVWTVTARWSEDPEFGPQGWALIRREIDEAQC